MEHTAGEPSMHFALRPLQRFGSAEYQADKRILPTWVTGNGFPGSLTLADLALCVMGSFARVSSFRKWANRHNWGLSVCARCLALDTLL